MAISFDNFLPNLVGGVLFLAVLAVAIFILFKIGASVFRRLRHTNADRTEE